MSYIFLFTLEFAENAYFMCIMFVKDIIIFNRHRRVYVLCVICIYDIQYMHKKEKRKEKWYNYDLRNINLQLYKEIN